MAVCTCKRNTYIQEGRSIGVQDLLSEWLDTEVIQGYCDRYIAKLSLVTVLYIPTLQLIGTILESIYYTFMIIL